MVVVEGRDGCHWSRRLCRRIIGSRFGSWFGRRRWRGCRCLLGKGEDPRDLIDGFQNSFY
jgi:hypothetical protein